MNWVEYSSRNEVATQAVRRDTTQLLVLLRSIMRLGLASTNRLNAIRRRIDACIPEMPLSMWRLCLSYPAANAFFTAFKNVASGIASNSSVFARMRPSASSRISPLV
jgi:hypothetical protein